MANAPIRVLIVDDKKDDVLLFVKALEELKIKTVVDTVCNTKELFTCLNESDTQLPQLLFLNMNMPSNESVMCLKKIKKDLKLKDVVVVVYSSDPFEKNTEDLFVNGANVCLRKPDSVSMLKKN